MSQESEKEEGLLPIVTQEEAINAARKEMELERSGEQLGLYCSWPSINRGMGKYWRFSHITLIAAPTGHGKSYALNQIEDDFTDADDIIDSSGRLFHRAINKAFKGRIIVIHFGFEIEPSDEVLRNLSRKVGKSYHYLLSSEGNRENDTYNTVDDSEFDYINSCLNYIKDRPIYYIPVSGNINQMVITYNHIKRKHPNCKFVVTIDHTLLITKFKGDDTDALMSKIAFLSIWLRKNGCMVILLGQCNNKLKDPDRILNPSLHYPNDSDIYYSAQLSWACDNIWIFPYRPELLNIRDYSPNKISTENLVIAACVKSRKGKIGDVYMENVLNKGKFLEKFI